MTLEEFETLRLADVEGLYQESIAERMGLSRATIGRLLQEARRKLASALVYGWALSVRTPDSQEPPAPSSDPLCPRCNDDPDEPCGCPRCRRAGRRRRGYPAPTT